MKLIPKSMEELNRLIIWCIACIIVTSIMITILK